MPTGYQIFWFDVKFLFTKVPLHQAIDIISRRICDKYELQRSIKRSGKKEVLILC